MSAMEITYKGYLAEISIHPKGLFIYGRALGLRDVLSFQGDTVPEAIQSFHNTVDDYLAWCEQDGRVPDTYDQTRDQRLSFGSFLGLLMTETAPASAPVRLARFGERLHQLIPVKEG